MGEDFGNHLFLTVLEQSNNNRRRHSLSVMTGLVPVIHAFPTKRHAKKSLNAKTDRYCVTDLPVFITDESRCTPMHADFLVLRPP